MPFKQRSIVVLIVLSLVTGLLMTSELSKNYGTIQERLDDANTGPVLQNINQMNDKDFTISQITKEGVIDPVAIRQSGYQTTDLRRGRTDTGMNTQGNITIDETNGWFVNQTEIEVTNLARLYGVNGTFDDGTNPWIAYSYNGGSNTQINSYNSSEEYVVCRNKGEYVYSPLGDSYRHSEGSEVGWRQVITNTPESVTFKMEFEFRYATGPIDPDGDDTFTGDIGVLWQLGSEAWYYPLQTLDSREEWYFVSDEFTIDPGISSFSVYLGLLVIGGNVRVYNRDYDDNEIVDGWENAQNLTLYLDDIELTGVTPPGFDEVELTFHAGGLSASVTGTGTGLASITNPDHWTASPLEYQITSNTSVAFTYSITSLFQRHINSSWSTSLNNKGVAYSIASGQSSNLTFSTYVTQSSTYQGATIDIIIPSDWENATIWDPLMNDITSLCTVTPGLIHVPTSELSRGGWWEINFNGLNYIKNTSVQVFDHNLSTWSESSLFRPSNGTRVQLEIGTPDTVPEGGDPTSISWIMPDESLWTVDPITAMVDGAVTSSVWTFGSTNTTAGEWSIDILWTNGTEIAFASMQFALFHSASITATYPIIETDHGLTISNLITFKDADTDEYLLDDSITMEANWSTTIIAFTQNYAKNWWEADFDTSMIGGGEYTVVVDASKPYFDPVSIHFTVVCFFRTSLQILNAGSIPIERGRNEIFTVQMEYELLNGTGVTGALPTVTHTGPGGGLSWQSFIDYDNGNYSIDIVGDISAIYEITIALSKPFHYNTTDSFTLIIGETVTELELLNGTADVVLFGGSYRLVVEYRNSTGSGLTEADLYVVTVTPGLGLTYSNFSHVIDGYYEIILTPSSAGTHSIVISASLLNHETQYATFTLTASGIPTILTSLPSSTTTAINRTFVLQLRFQDESFNAIDTATITLVNPPSGLFVSNAIPAGNGLYNITIQALEIKTFDLLFRASKNNYQSSSAGFTLVVTEIQTSLRFAGDITSTTIPFSETYELVIYYEQTEPTAAVQGANITLLPADIMDLEVYVTEYTGYYIISIRGHAIGLWVLSVVANKTDYRIATKQVLIEVERIDTTVQGSSPLEALLIGRSYAFTFSYIFESNSSYIHAAIILPFGEGADWISYFELGSGQYRVNLTPLELGDHYVLLTFEKTGFETVSYRLTFSVERVPIMVEVLDGLSAPESSQSMVLVRISEADTDLLVSGVQVYCFIIDPNGVRISSSYMMNETSMIGIYGGVILMPEAEGVYRLEITCEATNYVLSTSFIVQLQPERNIMTLLLVTTTRYYPVIIILAALGVGLVYRRSARKRRIRENKTALAVKRRFDDVKSLLGVIVLHKESGLPVYSKILRVGLEETVISAFITAITSFRGEFDIESTSEEWGLVPISDIVRVISTNRLVCAFITTGNPSPEQRERMIRFAKTVAFIFDETLHDVPIVVLDKHTKNQFDTLFEDLLDGALLRTYKLDEAKRFPTNTCALERIARKQGVEFKLEELASEIATCGLEEGRVYKAIMTALENHFLVTTDESPFTADLIRASETVEDES